MSPRANTGRRASTSRRSASRAAPFRQIYILDLGHEQPTILLTNEARTPIKQLITRYAHRMLIANALSDAVRFFHMDALSSAVDFKSTSI